MTRLMPTWVIIAALATIGVTALLTGVLYRLNAPTLKRGDADGGAVIVDPGHSRDNHASDTADGGGGDGGGGGD